MNWKQYAIKKESIYIDNIEFIRLTISNGSSIKEYIVSLEQLNNMKKNVEQRLSNLFEVIKKQYNL